jgi:hypothetical protein
LNDVNTTVGEIRVRSYLFIKRCTMAEISESSDSRQLLNELKGKMLALKEHL